MVEDKENHPIRRIRDALGQLPDRARLAEVKNFSRWVGCSESLIRNLENGVVSRISEKLAKSIEAKTGVSAKWLLSSPTHEEPIIDRRGGLWSAGRLDSFSYLPNLERLLAACPTRLPGVVAKLVEAQILAEMHEDASIGKLLTMLSILEKEDFFEDPGDGPHALSWLAESEAPEAMEELIINLLMDRSSTLSGEQIRDLENLRVTEPGIPEGSRLPEIYERLERQRRRRRARRSEG